MLTECVERDLPFPREQLYDVAADIERYPDFLPWWVSARIQKREADALFVDQVIGIGPFHVSFRSKAILHRPECIDVSSCDPPFRRYHLSMMFEALPAANCNLTVTTEIELESWMLQRAADRMLCGSVEGIVGAFASRARSIYGGEHA